MTYSEYFTRLKYVVIAYSCWISWGQFPLLRIISSDSSDVAVMSLQFSQMYGLSCRDSINTRVQTLLQINQTNITMGLGVEKSPVKVNVSSRRRTHG